MITIAMVLKDLADTLKPIPSLFLLKEKLLELSQLKKNQRPVSNNDIKKLKELSLLFHKKYPKIDNTIDPLIGKYTDVPTKNNFKKHK